MRPLFINSAICAAISLAALAALCCMSAPLTPNSTRIMGRLFAGVLLSASFWTVLAAWSGLTLQAYGDEWPMPLWLKILLILISVGYVVIFFVGLLA